MLPMRHLPFTVIVARGRGGGGRGGGKRGSTSAVPDVAHGMLPLVLPRHALQSASHVARSGAMRRSKHGDGRLLRLAHRPPKERPPPCRPGPAMVSAARKIRILTECSGLEPQPSVFGRLGLAGKYEMAAACEVDPPPRDSLARGPPDPKRCSGT